IAYATRQLQLGTLPMMLVGGVDSPLAWGILKGFTFMRIMTESWNQAPERGSRPFNLDRDGFVLAEGSWMFVLEEYEHARARGAAGVAATLIAMKHNQIPPTINLEKPDPDCDLDYVPEVGRAAQIEHAVCNCIAFGSKNSALVLRRIS